jgi:putative NADPH-quinone reductase
MQRLTRCPIDDPVESKAVKKKTVLIVYAQPEPGSLTRHLVNRGIEALDERGHDVLTSDLYAMNWKAVFDAHDFPDGRMSGGCRSSMNPGMLRERLPDA